MTTDVDCQTPYQLLHHLIAHYVSGQASTVNVNIVRLVAASAVETMVAFDHFSIGSKIRLLDQMCDDAVRIYEHTISRPVE